MAKLTGTRGPLPARVYWFRRVLVLVLGFGLVFLVAQLLWLGGNPGGADTRTVAETTHGSAGPSTGRHAGQHSRQRAGHQAGHHTSGGQASATAKASPSGHRAAAETRDAGKDAKPNKPRKTRTPLPAPTGPCSDDDVTVIPTVRKAHAGSPVVFVLELRTSTATACNWVVSPRHLVVKLTSGNDRIWSSQDCPGAIPHESVVVRSEHYTKVRMAWNGQRSDSTCSRTTLWAQPGYYHVHAAALGANPSDVQFLLGQPVRPTITPSPSPRKHSKEG